MKAMLLSEPAPIGTRPLVLTELPDPDPKDGEVRVRIEVCAICRTDLHVVEGDLPGRKLPIVPGHQAIGIIDKAGPQVRLRRAGERVGIAWLRHTCGACDFCERGAENLCLASSYTGYSENGGYAELACIHEDFCYPIPEALDPVHAAPLLCAGIIGYRALKRSNLRPGERLGIYGFGSSAHITAQIAMAMGAEVFVATRGEEHRRLARSLGIAWAGEPEEAFPMKMHRAIIFAPAGNLVPAALESLERGGTLALAGIYMTSVPALDYDKHLFHEKEVRSVESNTRDDGRELFERWSNAVNTTVTTFGLEEANQALQELSADRINGSGVLVVQGR